MISNKDKYLKILFNVYFTLFVLVTVNREFRPFGLDPRFIIIPLSILLICTQILPFKSFLSRLQKNRLPIGAYMYFCLLIPISLLNVSDKYFGETRNLAILFISNLLAIITLSLYSHYIKKHKTTQIYLASLGLLLLSMAFIYIFRGTPLPFNGDFKGYAPLTNFFGEKMRVGGYAEDPNYASLFISAGIILITQSKIYTRKTKYLLIGILVPFIMISASKTIYPLLVASFVLIAVKQFLFNKKQTKLVYGLTYFVSYGIPLLIVLFVGLHLVPFKNLYTMAARYAMWWKALDLFFVSPLIGTGLGFFRFFFSQAETGWYVQSHSTLFQLISETGIIGLVMYSTIISKGLKTHSKPLNQFYFILLIMSINFEVLYLSFVPLFIVVFHNIYKDDNDYAQHELRPLTVFINNSLSGGGAERVVQLLANYSSEHVDTLYIDVKARNTENTHFQYESVMNNLPPIIKQLHQIQSLNYLYWKYSLDYTVDVVTTHLPYAQLLVNYSDFSERNTHIIHGSFKLFGRKMMPKLLYTQQHLAYLSEDTTRELQEYRIIPKKLTKINNPIDRTYIEKLSNEIPEPITQKPYILWIGRLDENKDPMFALNAYNASQAKETHDLVYLGTGPLENTLKSAIVSENLDDTVHILGFKNNPFAIMANASLVINTSDSEIFPMTALETCALLKPFYATNSGEWVNSFFDINRVTVVKKEGTNNSILSYAQQVDTILNEHPDFITINVNDYSIENVYETYQKLKTY